MFTTRVRKTTAQFVAEVDEIFEGFYDCSQVVYQNAHTKVTLICPRHGQFQIKPCNVVSQRQGCRKCWQERMRILLSMDTEMFVRRGREVHGDLYDYSQTICTKSDSLVIFKCRRCDREVKQIAKRHLSGHGCTRCAWEDRKLSKEEILTKAHSIHGDRYEYDLTSWIENGRGRAGHIRIFCKRCKRWFEQQVMVHLTAKCGCPRCCNADKTSKTEKLWLDSLDIPEECRQAKIPESTNKMLRVDALVDRTVFEFYGSYFHGDPRHGSADKINDKNKKTYRQLYEKTIERQRKIEALGYEVKFVWEIDWQSGLTFSIEHPTSWSDMSS